MGRKSKTGGVSPLGNRIQFDIVWAGKRRRPTIDQEPTEPNLRRARVRMAAIQKAIALGTFDFAAEFPDYKLIDEIGAQSASRTVQQVCQAFIESLRARGELAFSTVESYRKMLQKRIAGPHGAKPFESITFTDLEAVVNAIPGKRKTFNNNVSAIREAWAYGYKDLPGRPNPALGLSCVRIPKREQVKPDPFTIAEAEDIIAQGKVLWGPETANYDEARFFAGFRPSEQIAIEWKDFDDTARTVWITKARVMARDKDETKTHDDRLVKLCPRAYNAFMRQRVIWERLKAAGAISHNKVFFREDGQPWNDLQVQGRRWNATIAALAPMRHRDPYNARHSSISWSLMMGMNLLRVASEHGHSAAVMLKTYAKWTEGATEEDIAEIREAYGFGSDLAVEKPESSAINGLSGGERGIRTRSGT